MGALGSALKGVAGQRRESARGAHPAGPYMKPGPAPSLAVLLRPAHDSTLSGPRAGAAYGESAPSNAGAKVRLPEPEVRNPSGGQSGESYPSAGGGVEPSKWFVSLGMCFPSLPRPAPACLPCPGDALLQTGAACGGDAVRAGPAGCCP